MLLVYAYYVLVALSLTPYLYIESMLYSAVSNKIFFSIKSIKSE